jgi:hypothetical protein
MLASKVIGFTLAFTVFLVTYERAANADLVNEDACAIWLCLPQGFLPSSCFPALIEFKKRQALPFTPAVPPLNQCLVPEGLALTDIETPQGLGLIDPATISAGGAALSATENSFQTDSRINDERTLRTDTFSDCAAIRVDNQIIGQQFCTSRTEQTALNPLTGLPDEGDPDEEGTEGVSNG